MTAYALGALLLPLVQILSGPGGGWRWAPPLAAVLGGVAAASVWANVPGPTFAWLGGGIVLLSGWLLPQATAGPATLLLGTLIGLGLGLGVASPAAAGLRARTATVSVGVGVLQLIALGMLGSNGATLAGALYALAMVVAAMMSDRGSGARGWRLRFGAGAAATFAVFATCWVGANSLTASWFGALVTHGSRRSHQVALTFDDGPDVRFTLAIRDVLDRYGVKGTFFTVGKALDARPDISRALRAHGHLLANHSYFHDALGWLDPRYPDLERTQRAFRRRVGVCPTFFRPPHGQHTPFMAREVAEHGMTMVGWDDSGGDWATSDAQLVARRILRHVKPGSIILLHDGLDGRLHADRSVVVRALPLILTGLKARRLRPVRLDRLLGRPGYGAHC
jgi:peptidoglycan/xylan/chitin deacetylase (PgdA/CDA1 family)